MDKIKEYYIDLVKIIESINHSSLHKAIEELRITINKGNNIFIAGNGGSATTATHLASDLIRNISSINKSGVSVISLVDNVAMLTALSNDHSYDDVFTKQLKIMMRPGDLLVAISASGNSKNILDACKQTHQMENKVVGITGFSGGRLNEISDIKIHVKSKVNEYEKVEDAHLSIAHVLAKMV